MAATVFFWVIIVAVILVRASRPQRTSVTRMWIMAGILMFVAGLAIYAYEKLHPTPAWEIVLALFAGLLIGVPVGVFRGLRMQVSATERPGVMLLGPSWVTAVVYIAAFGARALVRYLFPIQSALGATVGDALLAFAVGIVAGTYFMAYRKYETLEHAKPLRVPPSA